MTKLAEVAHYIAVLQDAPYISESAAGLQDRGHCLAMAFMHRSLPNSDQLTLNEVEYYEWLKSLNACKVNPENVCFAFPVTRVAANCNVEQAIDGMKDCKHNLHTIEKKLFNASNPEHVREACCATGRLETCLHAAVTSAGCLHEVDYVVKMLMKHLRDLLGEIYKANCWYGCGTGTRHGPQPVAVVTALSLATLLLTLCRTG